jgi:hypothetical protein
VEVAAAFTATLASAFGVSFASVGSRAAIACDRTERLRVSEPRQTTSRSTPRRLPEEILHQGEFAIDVVWSDAVARNDVMERRAQAIDHLSMHT